MQVQTNKLPVELPQDVWEHALFPAMIKTPSFSHFYRVALISKEIKVIIDDIVKRWIESENINLRRLGIQKGLQALTLVNNLKLNAFNLSDFPNQEADEGLTISSSHLKTLSLSCRDLQHCGKLQNLTTLNLHSSQKGTDNNIDSIETFTTLTTLNISDSYTILKQNSLRKIGTLINLTTLNLFSCNATDQDLQGISSLINLTFLALGVNFTPTLLTNDGLKTLSTLVNLKTLDLSRRKIFDKDLTVLTPFQKLTHLFINGCFNSTATCKGISLLKNLTLLDIGYNDFSKDDNFHELAALQNLKTINFEFSKFKKEHFFVIASMTNLTNLNFHGIYTASVNEKTWIEETPLTTLTNLNTLNLGLLQISQRGFDEVAKLPSLTHFILFLNPNITSKNIETISEIKNLKKLSIHGCKSITNHDIKLISKSENIETLTLSALDKLTKEGLNELINLKKLKKLSVTRCKQIGDPALDVISKFNKLEHLDISECDKFTKNGVIYLINLKNLTKLNISNCRQVTNEFLTEIAKIDSLKTLILCSQFMDKINRESLKIIPQAVKIIGFY